MCRATGDTGLIAVVLGRIMPLSSLAQATTTSAAVAAYVAISNDGVPVEGLPAATTAGLADNGTAAVLDGNVEAVPAVVAGLGLDGVVPERLDGVVCEQHPDLHTTLGVRPSGPAFPLALDELDTLGPRVKGLRRGLGSNPTQFRRDIPTSNLWCQCYRWHSSNV